MSRQNYYRSRSKYERDISNNSAILSSVRKERFLQPNLGVRKLYKKLQRYFKAESIKIGRDRLFDLLRDEDLLIKRKKKRAKTTNSRHTLPLFGNLTKDLDCTKSNQVWVSDITYIRIKGGYMYASLITDKYSRKIIGYHIGNSLESIGCQKALEMAMKSLTPICRPIHHSDRGSQYCCHAYVEMAQKKNIRISMTEENHCYENAVAERVNGILKIEYELDKIFKNKQHAIKALEQSIEIYNNHRPHMSLNYKTPAEVYKNGF